MRQPSCGLRLTHYTWLKAVVRQSNWLLLFCERSSLSHYPQLFVFMVTVFKCKLAKSIGEGDRIEMLEGR